MNLKQYITLFAIGTTIGWSAWVLVILSIDPSTTGILGVLIFYVSLAIGFGGLLTTISTIIRFLRFPERDTEEIVLTSLRQAFLLTALVIGALILSSYGWLIWWRMLILVGVVILIELAFIIRHKNGQK